MYVRGVSLVYVVRGHTCVRGVSFVKTDTPNTHVCYHSQHCLCCDRSYMCVRGVSFVYVVSGHTCVLPLTT